MMTWIARFGVTGTVIAASLPGLIQPVSAQTCTPLQAIGETTTTVEKAVSPPGTGITRDNWNTDFVVPSNRSFNRYVATIFPLNGGEYNVQMNLKYNNETADTVYNRVTRLPERRSISITGSSRSNANPYQVNLQVGGVPVIGNSYRVSVAACN